MKPGHHPWKSGTAGHLNLLKLDLMSNNNYRYYKTITINVLLR